MNTDTIVNMALVALPPDRVPTEDEIREIVERLAPIYGSDESIKAQVLSKLLTRCLVKMDTGFALVEKHVPWVHARRPEIEPYYWDRFKQWLQRQGWPAGVLSGLDRTTDEVLDLLGNPAELNTWKRRGLVMGDVQSGKTATYSALICKAADAGYRFIILLTGTIESLRQQTQARLDEGFVGFDSSELLKRNRRDLRVGVGLIDGRRQATVFTSSSADFRSTTLDTLGLGLNALREPAIVVIKKHTKILENLRDWLRSYNTTTQSGAIDIPTLIIDDEADNASINTNDENSDPTRVNERIRELLTLFRRTTYVGFTATPFANIFVNPDDQDGMLGDDLFPRDFIYTLQAPTNYFGPRRIFMDDSGSALHLRSIDDAAAAIPFKHRANFKVTTLPGSLTKALHVFLVANAIRDLRGEGPTHRSMLVNVSQFTGVQSGRGPDDPGVEGLLRAELERAQTAIRNFSSLPPATALGNATIAALHAAWEKEYRDCGFDWPAVQGALRKAVLPVTTIAVNQRTGPRALNYKAHKDTGLRVIAVGGNSLSRGLTLEGLVVSYFRRSTKMYDTLLQMGRWFGYRPGYEDLCRVWLPQDAIDWYGHISEATEELRFELKRMYQLRRTPKEFGLAVRASPDSLLVTARNKMRTAKEITRVISVNGEAFESVELHAGTKPLLDNWSQIRSFVEAAESTAGVSETQPAGPRIMRGVHRQVIANLLRNFKVPETEFRFQPDAIAALLDRMPAGLMEEWDVAIPEGEGALIPLGHRQFKRLKRKVRMDPPGVLEVSGAKRRVGSRGVEKAGLTVEETEKARRLAHEAEVVMAAEEGRKAKPPDEINIADKFYRAVRSRPLLLIHVLEPELEMSQEDFSGSEVRSGLPDLSDGALVAIGLSFPRLDAGITQTLARYKINVVKWREMFSSSLEPGDDDNFQEEP
ncbi:Z1 domain-containing protein [Myxococcus faecalis]|uniref:Z1 domain-containing protein n=1 Tax=Myxococcus faecalis TaxID=3115646 RepID=UPI003CECA5B3